jgi:hypothetical protein
LQALPKVTKRAREKRFARIAGKARKTALPARSGRPWRNFIPDCYRRLNADPASSGFGFGLILAKGMADRGADGP